MTSIYIKINNSKFLYKFTILQAEEQQRYNGIQTNGKKKQVTSEAEFRRLEID